MSKRVSVQIDGLMVLMGVALVGGVYVYHQRDEIIEALQVINPASDQNFVYKGVDRISIKGERNGHSYDDHFFALVDLANPWNESDEYAKEVWGF